MAFEGFKVTGTRELSRITRGGTRQVVVVVEIETDLGASGSVELAKTTYEKSSDEDLAAILVEKALLLDRAMTL